MSAKRKPLLVLDFDGVIHSYASGWRGADVCDDPLVPGFFDFLRSAVPHFRVAVYSARSAEPGGVTAMKAALLRGCRAAFDSDESFDEQKEEFQARTADFAALEWPTAKPPAFVTLDDRAVQFRGWWPAVDQLLAFQPWTALPPPADRGVPGWDFVGRVVRYVVAFRGLPNEGPVDWEARRADVACVVRAVEHLRAVGVDPDVGGAPASPAPDQPGPCAAAAAPAATHLPAAVTRAATDVLAERARQIVVEGWTAEHDDNHAAGELAQAAACYAMADLPVAKKLNFRLWPESWAVWWWKVAPRRRMLVIAAALLLAEIERLDRLEEKK